MSVRFIYLFLFCHDIKRCNSCHKYERSIWEKGQKGSENENKMKEVIIQVLVRMRF